MCKQIQITTQLSACQNRKKDKFGKMTVLPWKPNMWSMRYRGCQFPHEHAYRQSPRLKSAFDQLNGLKRSPSGSI